MLIRTVASSSLTLRSVSWGLAESRAEYTHIKKLEMVENRALRMTCDAPFDMGKRDLHHDFHLSPLKDLYAITPYVYENEMRGNERRVCYRQRTQSQTFLTNSTNGYPASKISETDAETKINTHK